MVQFLGNMSDNLEQRLDGLVKLLKDDSKDRRKEAAYGLVELANSTENLKVQTYIIQELTNMLDGGIRTYGLRIWKRLWMRKMIRYNCDDQLAAIAALGDFVGDINLQERVFLHLAYMHIPLIKAVNRRKKVDRIYPCEFDRKFPQYVEIGIEIVEFQHAKGDLRRMLDYEVALQTVGLRDGKTVAYLRSSESIREEQERIKGSDYHRVLAEAIEKLKKSVYSRPRILHLSF